MLVVFVQPVKAEEVCTTVYGGGVVCGVSTPEEHKPVETGIEDYLGFLAGGSIFTSGGLYLLSKKVNRKEQSQVVYQAS